MAYGQDIIEKDQSFYIPTERQAVGAMALVAARGPLGRAVLVASWPEFVRVFGDPVPGHVGAHCARTALEAGCWLLVTRVVHLADARDLATKTSAAAAATLVDRGTAPSAAEARGGVALPAPVTPGATLGVVVDRGAAATVTVRATPATVTGAGATYAPVATGHRLVLAVNGARRVVRFDGAAATADAYVAALNAALPGVAAAAVGGQVQLRTDRHGAAAALAVLPASDVDVLAALGLGVGAGANPGPNDVADADAVTAAEWKAVVEAAVPGVVAGATTAGQPFVRTVATGPGAHLQLQVLAGATLAEDLVLDTTERAGGTGGAAPTLRLVASSDGAWAEGTRAAVDDDPGDPATRFRVRVTARDGRLLETHAGLSMDPEDPRYVLTVLEEADSVLRAENLESPAAAPGNAPAAATVVLAGGADGLAGLTAADWLGDAAGRTGLHALDTETGYGLVAAPGVANPEVLAAAAGYAAAQRRLFIATVPYGLAPARAVAFRRGAAPYSHVALDTSRAALYFGWYRVPDPRTRRPLWLPVDGDVFAAYARSNKELGVWLAPAGETRGRLRADARDLAYTPSPEDVKLLQANGINVAVALSDGGVTSGYYLEGQATLQRLDSALARINVRLLTDFIVEQVARSVRAYRYEPNDPQLWKQLREAGKTFFRALAGKRAVRAWTVVCDESNNTAATMRARTTALDTEFVPIEASENQKLGFTVLPAGTELADAA